MPNEIKRGQAISFRVPSDTPDHILKHLQKLKDTERRNFSSKIAEFVMEGVSGSKSKSRETVTIPLPRNLTKTQRDWLKHEHSEALLGSILYQLISDPIRATSLLASLNSRSLDIEEALYLQEKVVAEEVSASLEEGPEAAAVSVENSSVMEDEVIDAAAHEMDDDDLDSFDWQNAIKEERSKDHEAGGESEVGTEDDVEDLLGGFLASMNK